MRPLIIRRGAADSPGTPVFFDDFNYAVARLDTGATKDSVFGAHGYTDVFDEQTNSGQASGYLYTATSVAGNESLPMPGASGRCLCVDALPGTFGIQSNAHLQIGAGNPGDLPAKFVCQMWLLINRAGSELSATTSGRNKFLYPLHAEDTTGYPLSVDYEAWLQNFGDEVIVDGNVALSPKPEEGAIAFYCQASPRFGVGRAVIDAQQTDNYWKMGPNNTGMDRWLRPNRWYLVQFYYDISQGAGVHQIRWREYGQQAAGFLMPTDWRHGVTSGFSWVVPSQDWPGPRTLQFPATIGHPQGPSPPSQGNTYIKIVDFGIYDDLSKVRTYGSY